MPTLKNAIALTWIAVRFYWLVSAAGANESRPGRRWFPIGGLSMVGVILIEPEFITSGPYRYSATLAAFPTAYPAYQASTKMLIPFIL